MADKKISALTAATTPLAGTEVLPIVQSGATVKVSVDNLTTGKAVTVGSLTNAGNLTFTGIGNRIRGDFSTATAADRVSFQSSTTNGNTVINAIPNGTSTNAQYRLYNNSDVTNSGLAILGMTATDFSLTATITGTGSFLPIVFNTSGLERLKVETGGDVKVTSGNLVIGTAGKGIDFSADANAAGMTSELLDDYEEGTWTPTQGAGLTVVGAFTSSGTYTKVGRQVTVVGRVNGATSVAATSGGVICAGLPFTVSGDSTGARNNVELNEGGSVYLQATSVYAIGAIAATGSIYFTATYFV